MTVLLAIPGGLVIATVVFAFVLGLPQLAPMRQALAQWRFKWLAYAIPFSPTVTYLMWRTQFSGNFLMMWPQGGPEVLLVTSISSAALAACWLCLPDDPGRRIHMGYTVLLAIVLWLLDAFVGGLCIALI